MSLQREKTPGSRCHRCLHASLESEVVKDRALGDSTSTEEVEVRAVYTELAETSSGTSPMPLCLVKSLRAVLNDVNDTNVSSSKKQPGLELKGAMNQTSALSL